MDVPTAARRVARAVLPERVLAARRALLGRDDGQGHFLSWVPPGHFYSPLPTLDEALAHTEALFDRRPDALPGIDLRAGAQLSRLEALGRVTGGHLAPGLRYRDDNPSFGPGDALVLSGMLRLLRPRRVVEVGSGFSSAVMLDTIDPNLGGHLDGPVSVTFVEPYPDVLETVLRPGDRGRVEVVVERVQDVDRAVFGRLEPGDVLFIDSSHVLRVGSDVHHLYLEVLPLLPAGVVVHVHDLFFPFEYPPEWYREGRAWNEAYLVRALVMAGMLTIEFWNDWIAYAHGDAVRRHLPGMLPNTGGSLWLRVAPGRETAGPAEGAAADGG